jgi:death-on-curing protein
MAHYLTAGDVVEINESVLEAEAIFDFGLLESAVLRPQQSVVGQDAYPGIHRKAAALFHSLVRNHPFLDGNKRTAFLATLAFYGLNGWWLDAEQGDIVALALDIAEGVVDVESVSKALQDWAHRIDLPEESS